MGAWFVAAALANGPALRCGTLEQLRLAPPGRRGPIAAAGGERGERDAYGVPHVRTSEHFAVRWGDDGPLSAAQADLLLDALELAWRVEVRQMAHEPPYGTDLYRFNVYVGDTGSGAPSAYGSGGYQTFDIEGWPMIVVARTSFADPSFVEHTAVHEFYHAIQSETGRFPYEGISAWYWEATAEWAATQAAPDNPALGSFAPGYTWLPELGIEFFDYPDRGTLEELHQYGAFLFPYDLSLTLGQTIVTDTWKDDSAERDPMVVMQRATAAAGEDFDQLWLDHLAHTVLLDHPLADLLEPHYESLRIVYPGESPVTRDLFGPGEAGRVDGDEAPRRHGASVLALRLPEDGVVRVRIDGDAEGTDDSAARWLGRVIVDRDEGPEVLELPFDGGAAELDVEAGGSDVYVIVAADTPASTHWERERFGFDYELTSSPSAPPVRRHRDRPRGCDQSGGGHTLGALALTLAALRGRARPAPRGPRAG